MNDAIQALTKKYANFVGRARRREFWLFTLMLFILNLLVASIESMFGMFNDELGIGPLSALLYLGTLIPSLAVGVRRMHDIGRSGWWVLTSIIPIWFIILACFDSKPGQNKWGPNPKENSVVAAREW